MEYDQKSPHVRHICFRQENGNQKIINFYKILSFFKNKYCIILWQFST